MSHSLACHRAPPFACTLALALALGLVIPTKVQGQAYGRPDLGEPGDRQIQAYLADEADRIHARFAKDLESREQWEERRPELEAEFFHMLGLWPLPERTPLEATVTGTVQGEGFEVELLHYQSMPGLYVTANLYRPATRNEGERFPAVLYVCGHSPRGSSGNKAAFQSHGIWFARNGYVCLIVDTLQLGEIAALHHGTYREQRWWWHSRGYTPAGVESWNGIRGIDYLVSRTDVDPDRLAVTGISGGGAATFWVACGDPRVQVAVPVSGMADLSSYITNRVINGHCDCMFLYNTFQWPWTRIAALIAPRPMLFVNSDQDAIFPMDANERISNRLERMYSLFGAGDQVDALVSIGGHAYRQDIRQGVARFINTHLLQDPRRVLDTEIDVVSENARDEVHPIPVEKLRVFARDEDLPRDERNTTIDEIFVPRGVVSLPDAAGFATWKQELLGELRRVSFGALPDRIPPARRVAGLDDSSLPDGRPGTRRSRRQQQQQQQQQKQQQQQQQQQQEQQQPRPQQQPARSNQAEEANTRVWLQSEGNLRIRLENRTATEANGSSTAAEDARIVLLVADGGLEDYQVPTALLEQVRAGDRLFVVEPRGIGATRWTRNNPPNYVERSHVLLGRTVDTGRVWDILATARYLREQFPSAESLWVGGAGGAGLCAAYAGWWEDEIDGVLLLAPPASHMDAEAPQFLNILRVADVPEGLGLLAPKPLTLLGAVDDSVMSRIEAIYQLAQAESAFQRIPVSD